MYGEKARDIYEQIRHLLEFIPLHSYRGDIEGSVTMPAGFSRFQQASVNGCEAGQGEVETFKDRASSRSDAT